MSTSTLGSEVAAGPSKRFARIRREAGASSTTVIGAGFRPYDDALPQDYENVHLQRAALRYVYRGKPLPALRDAFNRRNAVRYYKLLLVCSLVLVLVNAVFIVYDLFKHDGKDWLTTLLLIRLVVIVPATLAILAFTCSRWYTERPNLLIVPCAVFGIGMVVYSIVGRDPGYGTLALMVVFCYSFTPVSFFWASGLSCFLIFSFGTLMFVCFGSDTCGDNFQSADVPQPAEVCGMLVLFWSAVAVVGHNLEYSLRRSFLDEVIVRRQRDMLKEEKSLSDKLLTNMLPRAIAAQLKEGRKVVADEFAEVTVLFCEICDWARITEQISADSVVSVLNLIYSRFDRLIERFNVYKVETVGEVYMVVGGCPNRTSTHARDCARMALAMMECMPALRVAIQRQIGDAGLGMQIRIGLNSGPIVAGIVGIKNPRYKLFGDTVNTASRMESTSERGRIQCSDRTYPHLKKHFVLTARGGIPVKGKGIMQTHFVEAVMEGVSGEVAVAPSPGLKAHGSMRSHEMGSSAEMLPPGSAGSGDEHKARPVSLPISDRPRSLGGAGVMPADQTRGAGTLWNDNGEAAARAARELFADVGDIGDKQHLVDIFARHDDDDSRIGSMGSEDEVVVGEAADTMTTGPPSFTLNDGGGARITAGRGATTVDGAPIGARHADDMAVEDFESSLAIMNVKHVQSMQTMSKAKAAPSAPLADEVADAKAGPVRTYSSSRGGVVVGPPVSSRSLVNPRHMREGSVTSLANRPPADALGFSRRRRRGSYARKGVAGRCNFFWRLVDDGAKAVCLYLPSDTRVGSLEKYFQQDNIKSWRRFMRISGMITIVALAVFALVDVFKFNRDKEDEREKHDMIMIVRYAVLVPLILIYLGVSRLAAYTRRSPSYLLVQASSVTIIAVVGAGIIATSVIGGNPGFGVLAAFIVYSLNLTLIAYAYRVAVASALVIGHVLCITVVSNVTGFAAVEQFGYLAVFLIGQGLPVMGREYYNRDNYMRKEKLAVQQRQLKLETRRTDKLLENLLPRQIARQLKDGNKNIASNFDKATILFTDMKGFTAFSSKITPSQLVGFLNTMYSKFDVIANKYGIHKVEIIGDAYFSVAGCPAEMPDHAERCAAAAVEMQAVMPELRRLAGAEITMRVGIHTGPLVAGVVGEKDPRYHLFGHTVNLAMKMESSGVPGKIHVSEPTYKWLQHRLALAKEDPKIHEQFLSLAGPGEFVFEPREPMEVLGQHMQTYMMTRVSVASTMIPGGTGTVRPHAAGIVVGGGGSDVVVRRR